MSSLFGMLYTGVSGLNASQVAIDVTGHNLTNMKTPGYSRQSVSFVTNKPQYTYVGSIGKGVKVEEVNRAYDELLGKSVRTEGSSYNYYLSMQSTLKEAMIHFNELEAGSGLGDSLKDYFNAWSSLASSAPDSTDEASIKRHTLIEKATTLTKKINEGYSSINEVRKKSDTIIHNEVNNINDIVKNIAELNKQIVFNESGGKPANDLRDQRNRLVDLISEKTNVTTYEKDSGELTVFIAGQAIVNGREHHQLMVLPNEENDNHLDVYWQTNSQNNKPIKINDTLIGGKISAQLKSRDDILKKYIEQLDTLSKTIITETNRIHASGQGLERFTQVTGTNVVSNPKYPFSSDIGSLPYEVKQGTFRIVVYNEVSISDGDGNSSIKVEEDYFDIEVNPEFDNIYSIVEKINGADGSYNGGKLNAFISEDNTLQIVGGEGYKIAFQNDTSDFLMAAGINSFFTGTSAKDIGINDKLVENPSYIATGITGAPGDNINAKAISDLQFEEVGIGKVTIGEFYGNFIGVMGSDKSQVDNFTETKKMSFHQLSTRLESIRGVVEGEELINLSLFQRTFEANSRFITVVDEMINTIVNGLGSVGR